MLFETRDRSGPTTSLGSLRTVAAGITLLAAAVLAAPETACGQMCEGAASAAGGTTGPAAGTSTTGGTGVTSATSALSMVQAAQTAMQLQQQRNRQLQQRRQQWIAWNRARRSQAESAPTLRSARVSKQEAQARRDDRKRLREERWAIRKARLNRIREEIEAAKAQESDSTEDDSKLGTQVAAVSKH